MVDDCENLEPFWPLGGIWMERIERPLPTFTLLDEKDNPQTEEVHHGDV